MVLSSYAVGSSARDALPALAAQLTHDLNNQLTTIMGKAELALMGQDPQRWQAALQDVLEAGIRSQRLVADMQKVLSWIGAEHGPVPLREIVVLALRLAERRFENSGITVAIHGDSARAMASQAANLVIALWSLLCAARAVAPSGERAWRLELADTAAEGWSIKFQTPELNWSAEPQLVAAIAACPDQSRAKIEGALGAVQLERP